MTTPWKTTNDLLDETIKNVLQLIDWVDADIQHNQENEYVGCLEIDFQRRKNLKDALELLNQSYK
jgi:hypothetical protein